MPEFEFCLPPDSVPQLLRTAPFTRPGRGTAATGIWHDTADSALARAGMSLCETAGLWRLERSTPAPGELWPPGTPAPLLAEAAEPDDLGLPLPDGLMPVASFAGRQWTVHAGALTLVATVGTVHGVASSAPACRVRLGGPAEALPGLMDRMTSSVALTVPLGSLAAEAIGVAHGRPPPPRRTGAVEIPPDYALDDAIALVIGHLTDVILAVRAEAALGRTPDGVHQMRVAVRRLRSALSVFRHAAPAPALEALRPGLTELATVLGGARDWDVFLGGTGAAVATAMTGDPRLVAMLAGAQRRRTAAYTALRAWLGGPAFRALSLALVQATVLRSWREAPPSEGSAEAHARADTSVPARCYAAAELRRRHGHLMKAGAEIETLPIEALHDLRKQGKRLRYAAEFFIPLFGRRAGREFVARLADLQEALGHLNDSATAARLTEALGHGAAHHFAAGAVQGYTAAQGLSIRSEINRAWRKFRKSEPFW